MESEYKVAVKRLVLVDSVGFSYTEIPMDDHAILLAGGNVGKSSILNSLRLFMLPEENFQKSRIKFGFRTANRLDFYSNEDSYSHYFPSARSFIILEVENSSGTHCQILYRGDSGSLGYKRIFVPVPYSDLRDSFWDTSDPEGIGFAQESLTAKSIINRCKALSGKTQVVHDKKVLRDLLYSNDILNKDRSRYAILPMPHVDQQKVESLRTLIKMLFEVSHDSKSMALAVANIIENQKNYERDRFDFNINEFLQERDRIESDEAKLNKVKHQKPLYDELVELFRDYDPKSLSETYGLWIKSINSALEKTSKIVSETEQEVSDLVKDESAKEQKMRESGQKFLREQGGLNKSIKQCNEFKKYIKKAEPIVSQFPDGHPLSEIIAGIQDEMREHEKDLESLKDAHKAADEKAQLIKDIETLDHRINMIKENQRNSHYQLQNQLADAPASVLSAVNKGLLKVNPNRDLLDNELNALHNFCDLFDVQNSQVFLFGSPFDIDSSKSPSNEEILAEKEDERKEKARRLKTLKDASENPADKVRQINKLTKEIKGCEKELAILDDFDGAEKQVRRLTEEITRDQVVVDELKAVTEADKEAYELAKAKLLEAKAKLNRYKDEKKRFKEMQRTLDSLGNIQNKLITGLEEKTFKKLLDPEQITDDGIKEIQDRCFKMGTVREQIISSFRKFMELKILEDDYSELTTLRPSNEIIKNAWRDIRDIYGSLDQQEKQIMDKRRAHNEFVETYRTSLCKNRDFINNVQAQLNRNLESVQINDLAEIRVSIECDEAFDSLVKQSEQINPYTSESLSDAFYDQLKTFMNRFFKEDEEGVSEYRLTMEKVIKSISYKTRKASQSSFDSKSQSNSTTSLINLSLVQSLLKSLLDKGYGYSLPAVLDEVASVDISQMKPLLNRIKNDGFRLFGAATHSASGAVVLEIGRHFKLDEMTTSKPYNSERIAVYWGGPEGLIEGDENDWSHPEQEGLMIETEGADYVE